MVPGVTGAEPTIVLIGATPAALDPVAAVLAPLRSLTAIVLNVPIEEALNRPEVDAAAVVVVDVDARRRESLGALQQLMARIGTRIPVVVLTDAFDDALARWFLQIRVSDFLRKPVEPKEVLRACVRALRSGQAVPDHGGQIDVFVAAAGGVGTTTLAIEAAMVLMKAAKEGSTCLVDLDLRSGSCADYLDIEPRMTVDDLATHPERLDHQLLEVMLARHASGLSILAAPAQPAGGTPINPDLVLRLLDLVATRFDHVVIDMPRFWETWTDQVLVASNRVFIVTDMTVPGLRHGRRMADSIQERLPEVQPRVIVNRFQQTLLFGTGLRRTDVERALEGVFEGTVANNYPLVREAIDRGLPLDGVKSASNVSADLRRLVLAPATPDLARVR